MWMWEIDVATLFLMVALNITRATVESKKDSRVISLRRQIWDLMLLLLWLKDKWNKKQLEKMSISLASGANSLLRESKKRKTSLNLLFMSTIESLIFEHWNGISIFNDNLWGMLKENCLVSRRDLRIWLYRRKWALNYNLLLSFWRCKRMGIRLAIASISKEGNV